MNEQLGGVDSQIRDAASRPGRGAATLSEPACAAARAHFTAVGELLGTAQHAVPRAAGDCDKAERAAATHITELTARRNERIARLSNRIVAAMGEFRRQYPVETSELDDSADSADGYRELHKRLTDDDLPRFRDQFKTYLNQNTIRDIAGFQSQLNKQAAVIRERITTINSSLVGVDYNPGRYIRLEAQPTPHTDIRDFRADLRACTDDAVSGEDSDQYSEQKFLQVSRIIERFRGPRGNDRGRPDMDPVRHRRAELVYVLGVRTVAGGRHRVRALRGLGRQVRRAEGEARLHDPRRLPCLPVQAGVGCGQVADVPVRGHRRGVRPRFG